MASASSCTTTRCRSRSSSSPTCSGVPEDDRDEFRKRLTHKEPQSTQKMEHKPLEFLYEQFTAYIEDRRRAPRDDVMTGLATATFPDGTLPPVHDVMRIAANLFSAGGETTARLMSTSFRILGDRPDLQAALRDDPTVIPAFMEEALRLEPPIKGEFRLSKVAVTVGDMELAPGTSVFMLNAAANRDPRQFDDPLEFKLDRANGRQHIGFGHGIHSCAGAPLRAPRPRSPSRSSSRAPTTSGSRKRTTVHPTPAATSTTPRTCCAGSASCSSSSLPPTERGVPDGHLQPHRAGRHRPRAVEALLPGRVRLPVLVRDPAARRGDVEAQLPRAAARDHRVVPRPRRLRARAHGLRRRGRGERVPAARDERPRAHPPVDLGRRRARGGRRRSSSTAARSSRRATSASRCSCATPTASSSSSSPPTTATASPRSPRTTSCNMRQSARIMSHTLTPER